MRYQWRVVAGILVGGVLLGLAIAGLPNHHADAPLRVPITTTSVAPVSLP